MVKSDRVTWGSCMVACGDADGMVAGNTRHFSATVDKLAQSVGSRENEILFGLCLYVTKGKTEPRSRGNLKPPEFNSIDEGYSIGIFPEGGIKTEKVPKMAPFKNGAFAMALEKQVPILPVSLLGAYKIMKGSFFINWSPCEVVCHKPIYTDGFTTKDIDKFRDKCYKILQSELDKAYNE